MIYLYKEAGWTFLNIAGNNKSPDIKKLKQESTMKKLMVVLMGILFSASAFAQEAKGPEFKYSVWANAFTLTQTTAAKDEVKDYSNIRVRPKFTLSNENVSVVTRLEIDQFYGDGANTKYADLGADEQVVEVKNIYIDVKDMFMPGLGLKTGVAGYKYPIAFDNDAALLNVNFNAGMAKIDLAYIKVAEFDLEDETAAGDTEDDEQFYAAKVAINLGDITVTPAMLYAVGEENSSAEYALTMPAVSFAMKQGPLAVNADFVYVTGDADKAAEIDASAYAGYVNVGYKVSDALKVNVFGLYATGEDDDAETVTSFNSATWGDMEVGPMFIINDAGRINQVGVTNEYDKASEGLMMFGLAAEFKMDKLTVLGQIAYATTTSDELVEDTAIGTELNLRLAYEVAPKTEVWAEGAYLAAGDYVETKNGGENDSPMYYALGVMTSF